MGFLFYTTIVLFIFVCLILILLVLIQKGRGGGLSGAFGGGGGNTAFGAKTGDVLTWATSIVFGVFVLLAIALNLLANHRHGKSLQDPQAAQNPLIPSTQQPAETETPAETAVEAPAGTTRPVIPVPSGEPGAAPAAETSPTPTDAPATRPAK